MYKHICVHILLEVVLLLWLLLPGCRCAALGRSWRNLQTTGDSYFICISIFFVVSSLTYGLQTAWLPVAARRRLDGFHEKWRFLVQRCTKPTKTRAGVFNADVRLSVEADK